MPDWSNDQQPELDGWASCETIPVQRDADDNPISSSLMHDWWDNVSCAQSVTSVASEYDWLRSLWDLDTDEGYTFTMLTDVLAEADPHDWIPGPDPYYDKWIAPGVYQSTQACPDQFHPDALPACPYQRMAHDPNGVIRSGWSNQCQNGACR